MRSAFQKNKTVIVNELFLISVIVLHKRHSRAAIFIDSNNQILYENIHVSVSVKEKLTADPDSEIATTSLRVSLMCPVSAKNISFTYNMFSSVFYPGQLFSKSLLVSLSLEK